MTCPEITRLCSNYQLAYSDRSVRDKSVPFVGFVEAHTTLDEKLTSFEKILASLEASKTYIFVGHPGLDTPKSGLFITLARKT